MNTSKLAQRIAIFAGCALMLTASAIAKDQVERPVRVQASGALIASLIDGSYEGVAESGQATHTGLFTNEGSGYLNLETLLLTSGTGTATAANGDQLFWKLGDEPFTVLWTGGTGRFEGVTGGFTYVLTILGVSVDLEDMTVTITYSYLGKGTVTY